MTQREFVDGVSSKEGEEKGAGGQCLPPRRAKGGLGPGWCSSGDIRSSVLDMRPVQRRCIWTYVARCKFELCPPRHG